MRDAVCDNFKQTTKSQEREREKEESKKKLVFKNRKEEKKHGSLSFNHT